MARKPAVLFVCLGNICRSPLAEAAFRAAAERAGLEVEVDSAGTGHWHVGQPPDPRAQAIAREHGVDISRLRGRQIAPEDYRRFTHILALDANNLAEIRSRAPKDTTAEIALLLDYVQGSAGRAVADPARLRDYIKARAGQAVADPYHGGAEAFRVTWTVVSEAAEALVDKLRG